jgi:phosphatidylglycerol:prolipoprotein diacylglycerol transferase
MYPTLFKIGEFEVTSFGVMVAAGALVGLWLFGRELARRGLPESGVDAAIAGVLGGLAGAKLLWTIEHAQQGPFTELLFSRGGLSWFGGFLGGVAAGLWMLRRRGIPWMAGLAAATPALAPPTSVPVHPTQLYEAAVLVPIAWTLVRWRRNGVDDRVVFGRYLVMAGALRFAIEFVRVNERLVGPLTLAHMISAGIVVAGFIVLMRSGHQVPVSAPARRSSRR